MDEPPLHRAPCGRRELRVPDDMRQAAQARLARDWGRRVESPADRLARPHRHPDHGGFVAALARLVGRRSA